MLDPHIFGQSDADYIMAAEGVVFSAQHASSLPVAHLFANCLGL